MPIMTSIAALPDAVIDAVNSAYIKQMSADLTLMTPVRLLGEPQHDLSAAIGSLLALAGDCLSSRFRFGSPIIWDGGEVANLPTCSSGCLGWLACRLSWQCFTE